MFAFLREIRYTIGVATPDNVEPCFRRWVYAARRVKSLGDSYIACALYLLAIKIYLTKTRADLEASIFEGFLSDESARIFHI